MEHWTRLESTDNQGVWSRQVVGCTEVSGFPCCIICRLFNWELIGNANQMACGFGLVWRRWDGSSNGYIAEKGLEDLIEDFCISQRPTMTTSK
jgi:hypothetical protein